MLKLPTCVFIFLAMSNFALAQIVSGIVADAATKQSIGYVNIGVVGKGIGTVSDINGNYSILLKDSLNTETLRFSCIGYIPQSFSVASFKSSYSQNKGSVLLSKNTFALREVIVKPREYVTKVLGNNDNSKFLQEGFKSNDFGNELGILMHIKKAPSFIESANFNIGYSARDSVKFRLNIYSMKNGFPDTIILKEPIFVTTKIKSGTMSVDLKKYNLVVTNDFLVSLEWIEGYGKDKLYFCAGMFDNNCYYRKASQDKWQKAPGLGVGFNATVSYEK